MDVCDESLMTEIKQLKESSKNVSGCMITQLNGVVADMDPIKDYCENKNIVLVEDSAQGIGAFNQNNHSGSCVLGVVFHFTPPKLLDLWEMEALL